MYYNSAKEKSTSGGHYHQILFFCYCSETNTYQSNSLFCVIQCYISNNFFFNRFINAKDNGVFSIGSLISIVEHIPLKTTRMVSLLLFWTNNQSSCYQWITHRLPCATTWKQNNRKVLSSKTVESRLNVSYSLIKNAVVNDVIIKKFYLIAIILWMIQPEIKSF